jgi:hypothetical protein
MADTTERSMTVAPSSTPPEAPDPNLAVQEVSLEEVLRRPLRPHATELPAWLSESGEEAAATSAEPAPTLLFFEVDPEGTHLVRDALGAVYGAGSSFDEARAEYDAALDDHLRLLRARRDALSGKLRRQLEALEELFPGR